VHTPAAGSAERKAILDVLRVPCERDLEQKVVFRVDHLRVVDQWAFARVTPVRPNGGDIDYSRTKYREQWKEGAFDGEGEALLRRRGDEWTIVQWRFGATDTEVVEWAEKYRLPQSLFE
jgi:hypothetical protein